MQVINLRENVYQNEIFQSLNLSNDESKYIIVEKDTVYFVIPIKIEIKISIGNKDCNLIMRQRPGFLKISVIF